MAAFRRLRRTGTIGLALTAWDIWRKIPPRHRKTILKQARTHGPKVAKRVIKARGARPPER
jgi:hypothetical protein